MRRMPEHYAQAVQSVSDARQGRHNAQILWSVSRGRLVCILSAACRYAGKLREAKNAFLCCCLCVFELRTSFDRAPAGGFLVRRPQVSIAGKQGHPVKAREAARQGMALTG